MYLLNYSSYLIILILWWFLLIKQSVFGCMAGGGQTFICCPPFSSIGCAPSIPICSGYSSYGGNYKASQSIFYPRPFTYQINNDCNTKDGIVEEMEYQNINFDNSNSENGCNQQMPCPLENLNNLPLSISDENLPCIDGCSNENNLQINNYPCNTFPSLNYDLSSPLPFNIQLTELPIAAPQDLFNQQNDYDNLENNEILISSLTTLIPSSSPLPTSSSFSISSPVEVSPSIEEEQFISTDIIEVITSTELNSQNIYEDNNNKLLDTTNKINIDSYLNNNENNEQKIEEIINEAVNKEKPKEKENKSEDEELKINNNNCEDFELKKIVEKALLSTKLNNLEAARNIESNSANKFGGRFNSIVSNNEFAYVNWYGKRNCQLKAGGRHSLTWED